MSHCDIPFIFATKVLLKDIYELSNDEYEKNIGELVEMLDMKLFLDWQRNINVIKLQ